MEFCIIAGTFAFAAAVAAGVKFLRSSQPTALGTTTTPAPRQSRGEASRRAEQAARQLADLLGASTIVGEGRSRVVRGNAEGIDFRLRVREADLEVRIDTGRPLDHCLLDPAQGPPGHPGPLSWLTAEIRRQLQSVRRDGVTVGVEHQVLVVHFDREGPLSQRQHVVHHCARLAALLQRAPPSRAARLAAAYSEEASEDWRTAFARAILDAHESGEPSPGLPKLLTEPTPHIRARAALLLLDVPTIVALAADEETPRRTLVRVLRAISGDPGFASVARAACTAGVDLSASDLEWVLEAVLKRPSTELEPVLLQAVEHGSIDRQRRALRALGEVGTLAAVPALRAMTERWGQPRRSTLAADAVTAIRRRSGGEEGGVSLVDPDNQSGGVSMVDPIEAGRLSESRRTEPER